RNPAHKRDHLHGHGTRTPDEKDLRSTDATAAKFKPHAGWPQSRRARVSGNLPFVLLAEQFGHQYFELQVEESVRTIAEELFRLRVHANDLTLAIHNEDSFRRGVEHGSGRSITERGSFLRHDSFRCRTSRPEV